jgi:hypothetical protein
VVEHQLGATAGFALCQRAVVEERQGDCLFDLVGEVAGQQQPGGMGLDQFDLHQDDVELLLRVADSACSEIGLPMKSDSMASGLRFLLEEEVDHLRVRPGPGIRGR